MKKNILIIDDDFASREQIKNTLNDNATSITCALSVQDGLKLFIKHNFCLVIMDLLLVENDGMALLKTIHKAKKVPIFVLSTHTDPSYKIEALLNGADDYLSKPFHEGELNARVQAILRRYNDPYNANNLYVLMTCPDLVIDPQFRSVEIKGLQLELTKKEFEILYLLAKHPGQVFSKEQIYTKVWGNEFIANENSVMCHIWRIRVKFKEHGENVDYIKTVWGVGYCFFHI